MNQEEELRTSLAASMASQEPRAPQRPSAPLTPAHSRLVTKLASRPALADMAAAEVGRLVARVRGERGGLSGLGVEEIAAEVRRLGREEECPVCLDTMVQGELTRCTRCRQLFHSRWGMGELCSKAQSLKSKLLNKVFYINHYFAVFFI